MLRDLAVMLAHGGDCLSDLAALRDQPELFGPVASIIRLDDLVEHLGSSAQHGQFLPLVRDYRERYGVTA